MDKNRSSIFPYLSYFYPYSPIDKNKLSLNPPISIHIVLWIKIDLKYLSISSYFYPYSPMDKNKLFLNPPISIHIVLWIKIDPLYFHISPISIHIVL